jgi:hypothetical protein
MRVDYEPKQWGPAAWQFLHTVTFGYPDDPDPQVQDDFRDFFRTLQTVLPCANCRSHYGQKLREAEALQGTAADPFASRRQLSQWLVDLHNDVNQRQRKKQIKYDEVHTLFQDTTMLCPSETNLLQTAKPQRWSPSRIALVLFSVAVLLFLTIAVLAYLGCSCGAKKIGA